VVFWKVTASIKVLLQDFFEFLGIFFRVIVGFGVPPRLREFRVLPRRTSCLYLLRALVSFIFGEWDLMCQLGRGQH